MKYSIMIIGVLLILTSADLIPYFYYSRINGSVYPYTPIRAGENGKPISIYPIGYTSAQLKAELWAYDESYIMGEMYLINKLDELAYNKASGHFETKVDGAFLTAGKKYIIRWVI
jgi:hypothetical protein